MTDAPEKIWLRKNVEPLHDCGDGIVYFDDVVTCAEYIRADVVDEMIETAFDRGLIMADHGWKPRQQRGSDD